MKIRMQVELFRLKNSPRCDDCEKVAIYGVEVGSPSDSDGVTAYRCADCIPLTWQRMIEDEAKSSK